MIKICPKCGEKSYDPPRGDFIGYCKKCRYAKRNTLTIPNYIKAEPYSAKELDKLQSLMTEATKRLPKAGENAKAVWVTSPKMAKALGWIHPIKPSWWESEKGLQKWMPL